MEQKPSEDVLKTELPLERFGARPKSVLQQLDIRTVGEFLETDWDSVQCWQLGDKARTELKFHREAMGQSPEQVRAWLQDASLSPTAANQVRISSQINTFHVPDRWHPLPLALGNFSTRAQGVLERSDLTTLGAFLEADFETLNCPGLGVKGRTELLQLQSSQRQLLQEALQSPDPNGEFGRLLGHLLATGGDAALTLPTETDLKWVDSETLDLPAVWPLAVSSLFRRNERTYK